MKRFILIVIAALMITSCRTQKVTASTDRTTIDSTATATTVVERVVWDTVRIEIPSQAVEGSVAASDTSRLETDWACSAAWIDRHGRLKHQLTTKQQVKEVAVPTIQTETTRSTATTNRQAETKIVERKLGRWEQTKLNYGGWAMIVAAVVTIAAVAIIARSRRRK